MNFDFFDELDELGDDIESRFQDLNEECARRSRFNGTHGSRKYEERYKRRKAKCAARFLLDL